MGLVGSKQASSIILCLQEKFRILKWFLGVKSTFRKIWRIDGSSLRKMSAIFARGTNKS